MSEFKNVTDPGFDPLESPVFDAETMNNMRGTTNPNILHNWDFRNPVNQRGQTEYIVNGYTINRWAQSGPSLELVNGLGIRLTGVSAGYLIQTHENPSAYLGGTYTLSVMHDDEVYSSTFTLPNTLTPGSVGIKATPFGNIHIGVAATYIRAVITVSANTTAIIQAVKLEPGKVSTLPNDAPVVHAVELPKCQMHQVLGAVNFDQSRLIRAAVVAPNYLLFDVTLPQTLRVLPAISLLNLGIIEVRAIDGFNRQEGFTFTVQHVFSSGLRILAEKTAHGLTDGTLLLNRVLFDANM